MSWGPFASTNASELLTLSLKASSLPFSICIVLMSNMGSDMLLSYAWLAYVPSCYGEKGTYTSYGGTIFRLVPSYSSNAGGRRSSPPPARRARRTPHRFSIPCHLVCFIGVIDRFCSDVKRSRPLSARVFCRSGAGGNQEKPEAETW